MPGNYNPLVPRGPGALPHGALCPLCKYIASSSEDQSAINHVNIINDIIKLCGVNADNIEATSGMISSYWDTNVRQPRLQEGAACDELTPEMSKEHLVTVVLDGMSDARKTLRNISAMENLAVSQLVSINQVTGEKKLDMDACRVLLQIPAAKRTLHECQWSRSQFSQPSKITPEMLATVASLLRIYSE